MLVRIHSIPEDGLNLSFVIPHKKVRETFTKEDETSSYFQTDVNCEVHLDLNQREVFLSGNARTEISPVCARCSETFKQIFSVDLALTCNPSKVPFGADYKQESDEGVVYYKHEELDLSLIVREQLLISLPMKYVCKPDCKGLCPQCGANLNEGEHACNKRAQVK